MFVQAWFLAAIVDSKAYLYSVRQSSIEWVYSEEEIFRNLLVCPKYLKIDLDSKRPQLALQP